MSIFRRNKDAEPAAAPAADPTTDGAGGREPDAAPPSARPDGPFDVHEVGGRAGRIDLGALWVAGMPGMELRLEVEQESQQVNAVTIVLGDSALQLQAFAAPRSTGLWDDIRSEIATAVEHQGGTAEETDGPLGPQLRTRMPSAGPDGRTVFAPAIFLGVDGPRWFLRGVLSGRGAIDESAAQPLLAAFKDVVVVRGVEPMAPREMLALQLPADPRGEARAAEPEQAPGIDPFERGPEITEVR